MGPGGRGLSFSIGASLAGASANRMPSPEWTLGQRRCLYRGAGSGGVALWPWMPLPFLATAAGILMLAVWCAIKGDSSSDCPLPPPVPIGLICSS